MEMDRGTMLEFPNSKMLALLSPHCGINIIFNAPKFFGTLPIKSQNLYFLLLSLNDF